MLSGVESPGTQNCSAVTCSTSRVTDHSRPAAVAIGGGGSYDPWGGSEALRWGNALTAGACQALPGPSLSPSSALSARGACFLGRDGRFGWWRPQTLAVVRVAPARCGGQARILTHEVCPFAWGPEQAGGGHHGGSLGGRGRGSHYFKASVVPSTTQTSGQASTV